MSRPLILFGGGLDSCAMVEMYHHLNPMLLHFNWGQKAALGEGQALLYFADKYHLDVFQIEVPRALIPDSPLTTQEVVTDKEQHASNYIPGRNLLFSAMAYSFAAKYDLAPVMLGASPAPPGSAFRDAALPFQINFNMLIATGYPEKIIPLLMPLVQGVRANYLRVALKKEPRLFKIAFTCYESSSMKECGVCVHCQQKAALAKELGAA